VNGGGGGGGRDAFDRRRIIQRNECLPLVITPVHSAHTHNTSFDISQHAQSASSSCDSSPKCRAYRQEPCCFLLFAQRRSSLLHLFLLRVASRVADVTLDCGSWTTAKRFDDAACNHDLDDTHPTTTPIRVSTPIPSNACQWPNASLIAPRIRRQPSWAASCQQAGRVVCVRDDALQLCRPSLASRDHPEAPTGLD